MQIYLRVRRRRFEHFVPRMGQMLRIDPQMSVYRYLYGGNDNSDRRTEPLVLPYRLSISGGLPIAEAMPLSAPEFLILAEGVEGLMLIRSQLLCLGLYRVLKFSFVFFD